jgi:hypothetical protein
MPDHQGMNPDKSRSGRRDPNAPNRTTRREWLAEIGAAALVAGLPAGLERAGASEGSSGSILPPGLYAPSSEHLGHALERDELCLAIPAGSQTDYVQPTSGAFQPAFFSEDEFRTVRRMVQLLLALPDAGQSQTGPAQQDQENPAEAVARWIDLRMASAAAVRRAAQALSPGHRALAVHFYGPEKVRHLETEEPERTCREGLEWLDHAAQEKYGAGFPKLSKAQQIEILRDASDASKADTDDHPETEFFELIKNETIRGYYTSRRGLHELDYKGNSFYPQSPGCPKGHDGMRRESE